MTKSNGKLKRTLITKTKKKEETGHLHPFLSLVLHSHNNLITCLSLAWTLWTKTGFVPLICPMKLVSQICLQLKDYLQLFILQYVEVNKIRCLPSTFRPEPTFSFKFLNMVLIIYMIQSKLNSFHFSYWNKLFQVSTIVFLFIVN